MKAAGLAQISVTGRASQDYVSREREHRWLYDSPRWLSPPIGCVVVDHRSLISDLRQT